MAPGVENLKFNCPLCKSKSMLLNSEDVNTYFCSECCIEFTTQHDKVIKAYEVTISGELLEIKL